MKFVIAAVVLLAAIVGCSVWVYNSTFELRPVGTTATFEQSVDCLNRYANNYKGWVLDRAHVEDCFPTQTAATEKALIACFNKYERSHPDHTGWPEDNMRGCRWSRVARTPPEVRHRQQKRLVFGAVATVPSLPRAGERFESTVAVTLGHTGPSALDTNPTLAIEVTLDDQPLSTFDINRDLGFTEDDKLRLSFLIPETAGGKSLTITMKVIAHNQTATNMVTFTIEPK